MKFLVAGIFMALASLACTGVVSLPPSDSGESDASVADAGGLSDGNFTSDAGGNASPDGGLDSGLPGWTLTWSDEFDGPDGSAPNPAYWTHEVGGSGWGNNELEYYTDGAANTYVENGNLVIVAKTQGASQYQCANDGAPGPCQYTSGRIITMPSQGSSGFTQAYGRFEARMKLPPGQGLWPAFWLLGTNINQVGWPACGEIDVMENLGQAPQTVYGHLHMPDTSTGNYGPGTSFTSDAGTFASDFHVFAIEWQPGQVQFFVDGQVYDTIDSSSIPGTATWEFDGHPFYILLNLAVGSKDSWPGAPNASTQFPAEVLVDYVRVYQKS
jgi:beta-glucanase (GH16 family)